MSRASSSTLRRIIARDSAIPGRRSGRRSRRWTEAMTGVRGVRSSCDRVARKRSLAALASSARWRASSSSRLWRRRSVTSRIRREMPMIRPVESRIAERLTTISIHRPSLVRRRASNSAIRRPARSSVVRPGVGSSQPGGASSTIFRPIISAAVNPKSASAPGFQSVMTLSSVSATMAYATDAAIAARRCASRSARRCAAMSRKTRTTPSSRPRESRIGAAAVGDRVSGSRRARPEGCDWRVRRRPGR